MTSSSQCTPGLASTLPASDLRKLTLKMPTGNEEDTKGDGMLLQT